MVIWPEYWPPGRFSPAGLAVTVSCNGVMPVRGETASQLPPLLVEAETVTCTGLPLLITVPISGRPAGWFCTMSMNPQQSPEVKLICGMFDTVSETFMVVGHNRRPCQRRRSDRSHGDSPGIASGPQASTDRA